MRLTIQTGGVLALVFSQLVCGWNVTIYDSSDCTGDRYDVYPTAPHTKYFEMKGSEGAEMICTFHGTDDSTASCKEQFSVGKSVLAAAGLCRSYSAGHASGEHDMGQKGECRSPDFSILSVACWDE
ncbi:hypothetical protein F4777DRAFT_233286 [Nemania sp. FL0916]|nr:hypothetical protein F4777DRAFT_233286 [Nemania sp. FL0916]